MTDRQGRSITPLEEAVDEKCPTCKGEGDILVDYWRHVGTGQTVPVKDICPACKGTGNRQEKETGE